MELSHETVAYQNSTYLHHNIRKSAQTEQKLKNVSQKCFVEPYVNGPFDRTKLLAIRQKMNIFWSSFL